MSDYAFDPDAYTRRAEFQRGLILLLFSQGKRDEAQECSDRWAARSDWEVEQMRAEPSGQTSQ